MVPEGDLFATIREGRASVVTDTIETFTEHGIRLASGEELEADVVVTATGFDLSLFGEVAFTVDDEPVDFTRQVTWRGTMITGVPNMAYVFGYFRSSWTLRADLVSEGVRLPAAGAQPRSGARAPWWEPQLRPQDADMELLPWSGPGELQLRLRPALAGQDVPPGRPRAVDAHAGARQERDILPKADLDDGTLTYR